MHKGADKAPRVGHDSYVRFDLTDPQFGPEPLLAGRAGRRRRPGIVAPAFPASPGFPILPSWARPRPSADGCSAGAFLAAGASLALLDAVLRIDPIYGDVLRQRLALRAAAASARFLRLREDEVALRDVTHLAIGDEVGPAGRIHRLWRSLKKQTGVTASGVSAAFDSLDLEAPVDASTLLPEFEAVVSSDKDPVSAAAEAASVCYSRHRSPEGEILSWWVADVVLGVRLRWRRPLPLLATRALDPALRHGDAERRSRPGDQRWAYDAARAFAMAAADAYALAGQLERRYGQLLAVQPKLRAKRAAQVIELVLGDDCVSAARAAKEAGLSDRAARRLFDRLVELQAVQEVSGRPNFRLYGL